MHNHRHLEFLKGDAISLLLDLSSPNPTGIMIIWQRTQPSDQKCIITKIQDGGRHNLEFQKCVAISLLLDQSSTNLMGMLKIWHTTQLSIRNAYLPNQRWRPPPSWISKICCHFFAIRPILTKFGGNVENLTLNATIISKMQLDLLHVSENSTLSIRIYHIGVFVKIAYAESVQSKPNGEVTGCWHQSYRWLQNSSRRRVRNV